MAAKTSAFLFPLVVMLFAAMATALAAQPVAVNTAIIKIKGSIFCTTPTRTTPIQGATAVVKCHNVLYKRVTQFVLVSQPTDKNGIYTILLPVETATQRLVNCRVFLNASPLAKCNIKLRLGIVGVSIALPNYTLPNYTTSPSNVVLVKPMSFAPAA